MFQFKYHYIAIVPMILSNACSSGPDATTAEGPEKVGETSAPLVSGEYSWAQGSGPTSMWSTSQGYCFLTGVTGHFVGGGENVYVTASNGTWQLTGSSGQQGVAGWARCISFASLNNNRSWNDSWGSYVETGNGNTSQSYSINLGAWTSCGLAGMGGAFDSPNDTVYVSRSQSGSQWDYTLGVFHSDSNDTNETRADGECMNLNASSNPISISSYGWNNYTGQIIIGSTSNTFCQFTEIAGQFESNQTSVRLLVNSNNQWVLTGSTANYNLAASVDCFSIPVN